MQNLCKYFKVLIFQGIIALLNQQAVLLLLYLFHGRKTNFQGVCYIETYLGNLYFVPEPPDLQTVPRVTHSFGFYFRNTLID